MIRGRRVGRDSGISRLQVPPCGSRSRTLIAFEDRGCLDVEGLATHLLIRDGNMHLVTGNDNDLPRVCPATDGDRTWKSSETSGSRSACQTPFRGCPAGHGDR